MTISSLLKELNQRPDIERTLDILVALRAASLMPRHLRQFHEALLFGKAYPRSIGHYQLCAQELNTFERRIKALTAKQCAELDQSGIIGTHAFYSYDLPNVRWLLRHLGTDIEIDWDEYEAQELETLDELIPRLIHCQEADALDDPATDTRDFLEMARGSKSSLRWIVEQIEQQYPGPLCDQIYDPLKLPLRMRLRRTVSRTTVSNGSPRQIALWDPAAARAPFDFVREIQRPLTLPKPVSERRGRELLNLVHATLLCRLRELYPMTYGNPQEVYDVPFERGIRIVFWMMLPERRLPLEVGWDFLMLRNNVPIAYGGGGLIHNRLEHAINVFETFRGGDAAWLFAQISRIAYSLNPAPWIVVRKFQLGGDGNTEGIKSGSYWFYDKLGFRSTDKSCRALADKERKLIAKDKLHRTPITLLRKFAEADVVLSLAGAKAETYREYPLSGVGLFAARILGQHRLVRAGAAENMQHVMRSLPEFATWSSAQKAAVLQLAVLKYSRHEADYARALRQQHALFAALERHA